jgi:hypothetical protein
MDDPNREGDWDLPAVTMKEELDKRFAEADKEPIILPVEKQDGQF